MKAFGGVGDWLQLFLKSAVDGGKLLASLPSHLISGEKDPGSHCVGSRAGLNLATASELYCVGHHSDCHGRSVSDEMNKSLRAELAQTPQ